MDTAQENNREELSKLLGWFSLSSLNLNTENICVIYLQQQEKGKHIICNNWRRERSRKTKHN